MIADEHEQAYIYALCDPDSGDVRYVGQTLTPEKRLSEHLTDKYPCRKTKWIAELRVTGKRPVMRILTTCAPGDRFRVETEWLVRLRGQGAKLTNSRYQSLDETLAKLGLPPMSQLIQEAASSAQTRTT